MKPAVSRGRNDRGGIRQMKVMRGCTRCEVVSWCLAVTCLLVAILSALLVPRYADHLLNTQFTLKTSGPLHDMWVETPMPMALDFYLFNWTNHQELLEPGFKPRLQQLGPYRFREKFRKVNVTFYPDNHTVSYRNLKTWWWDEEESNGKLTDKVITLNVVAVSAAYAARNFNYLMKRGLSLTLSAVAGEMHVEHTAGELLFEGYEDRLITLVNSLPAFEGMENPGWDRFAWFYGRNGSNEASGEMLMTTGLGDVAMGQLQRWQGDNVVSKWKGRCAEVRGSAGEFFPPHLQEGQLLDMFLPEMCRSVTFDWAGQIQTNLGGGLTGYKFVGGERMLDNGSVYSENACFCPGECQRSGMMNVSACRYGSPGFLSLPHFHRADPWYLEQVSGLSPSTDKHDFYLVLEPRTGIPLEVAARFQINILVSPVADIAFAADLPTVYFPMLWLEQKVTAPSGYAAGLAALLAMSAQGQTAGYTAAALALLALLVLAAVRALRARSHALSPPQSKDELPLNPPVPLRHHITT